MLAKLLGADDPNVRAAAVFTLGTFIQTVESSGMSGSSSSGTLAPASPSPTPPAGVAAPPSGGAGDAAAAGTPASAAAAAAGPLPDAERWALERAIACALLEVVYDASPLVRCVLLAVPVHA